MKYKFEEGEEVIWAPMPGWSVEATVMKHTHLFWIFPAYRLRVEEHLLYDWSHWGCVWTVPEAAIRKGL